MLPFLRSTAQFLRKRRFLAIWAAGMASTVFVLVAAFAPYSPLDRLNALVFDIYQNFKPRQPTPSPVLVVDIDDASIAALGQWPWPRTVLATMVDRLADMGVAAVGFDILFSEPDRTSPALAVAQLRDLGFNVSSSSEADDFDHDRKFAESFRRVPVVTGLALAETARTPPPAPRTGFAFGGADPATYLAGYDGSVRNLPALDEAAAGIGIISFPPGWDGIVRQIPLISRYERNLYPAMAMELLRVAQGASTLLIRSTGAGGELDTGNPGMVAIKNGDFEVPTGADGTLWVYYTGTPQSAVVPAARVLAGANDPELAELAAGRIVLVGTSAIGLRDIVSTPLQAGVPGVFVHAEILDQIVSGTFLSRPDWALGAEIAAAALLSLLVLAFLPWLPSTTNGLVAAGAIGASIGGGWLAFSSYNLLLSPVLPVQCSLLAYAVGSGVRLLLSERERRFIRDAFTHYLAPSMVQQLMDNPHSLELGGEDREVTLLFCDIRGFTGISERLGPIELTEFLNNFLTPMTDVLMAGGATIDKYMGDAIMAFWNAPIAVPDHRRRACECVLNMQAALSAFNRTQAVPVSIGIGLNTGVCCVGNLGSKQRFDYSAIGDPVNVASRVEGMTKQYGLTSLLSDSTAEGSAGLAMLEVDRVQLYGRGQPTPLFTILGDAVMAGRDDFVALKKAHDGFLAHYRARDFEEAERDLARLASLAPPELKKLYAVFADRCVALLRDPPPPGWDGTYKAEQK